MSAASAQQHDARYEQHRRKTAGGKKERPSPLLPFDCRTAQLTPAEYFRLGHGSWYSVILHCFTLLYYDILNSDFIQEVKKHRQTGADGRFVLPQAHLAGQRDAGLGHAKEEKSARSGALPVEQ